jgi:protein-S-isoprenylcysteine O-methyltransferase Ste14
MRRPFIKAILILPGTALVYVPALIVWLTRDTAYAATFPPEAVAISLVGLPFAIAGLMLMFWTMRLFAAHGGGGTPAPWEPVKNFIVLGPYRHVRNPMLIGVILMLLAEAVLLWSLPILLWAIIFVVINNFYFALSEEPQLEKRFGQAYTSYKRSVGRWVPRLTPYPGDADNQVQKVQSTHSASP